jgi:hypothetical protein
MSRGRNDTKKKPRRLCHRDFRPLGRTSNLPSARYYAPAPARQHFCL